MSEGTIEGTAAAVHLSGEHHFSKEAVASIQLLAGIGVDGDAHAGPTVRHRSRVAADPNQPNLRQVHLVESELFDFVGRAGFEVRPGDLGENITTSGIELLELPVGSVLSIGTDGVLLCLTGARNPCGQINGFSEGLLAEVKRRGPDGSPLRQVGPMAVVISGGRVAPGDDISVSLPPPPHVPLTRI